MKEQRYARKPGIDLTRADLTAEEGALCARLEGAMSVGDVASMMGVGSEKIRNQLDDLVRRGVLVRVDEGRHGFGGDKTYGNAVFPPHLMGAPCGLDEEQRKRVIHFHGRLNDMHFYELLGVGRRHEGREIQEAFRERSKQWHPDRWPREKGPFGPMLQDIFKRIQEARKTLTDVKRREVYDAEFGHLIVDEDDLAEMRARQKRAEREKRREEEAKRRRRARNPILQRVKQAEKFFKESQDLMATGDLIQALRAAQTAAAYDDGNAEYKAAVDKLTDLAAEQRIGPWMKRGQQVESLTKWEPAIESFKEAVRLAPEHPQANLRLAACLMRYSLADPQEFWNAAHKAVEVNPSEAEAYYVMAVCYERRNMKKKALDAVQKALEIRPNYQEAKKLQRKLRYGF